jgi:hypothetical protein
MDELITAPSQSVALSSAPFEIADARSMCDDDDEGTLQQSSLWWKDLNGSIRMQTFRSPSLSIRRKQTNQNLVAMMELIQVGARRY